MKPIGIWILLLLRAASVEAQSEDNSKICYVLDGILVIYGIVLTVLYCRLRMQIAQIEQTSSSEKQESLYQDLRGATQDTYEKLPMKK